MPKLIIIVVGLVFALIGYRKTWYPSWAYLFNVLIAVYISIMITPQVVDKLAVVRHYLGGYSYAVFALTVAAVIFAVMHFLSFRYFTVAANVPFLKICDSVGAAILGFLTGVVIAGFLLFLIAITPLSKYSMVKNFTQGRQDPDRISCVIAGSCHFIHDISLQPIPDGPKRQLEWVIMGWNRTVEKLEDANSSAVSNAVQAIQKPIPAGARTKKLDNVMTDLEQPAETRDANTPSDSNLAATP